MPIIAPNMKNVTASATRKFCLFQLIKLYWLMLIVYIPSLTNSRIVTFNWMLILLLLKKISYVKTETESNNSKRSGSIHCCYPETVPSLIKSAKINLSRKRLPNENTLNLANHFVYCLALRYYSLVTNYTDGNYRGHFIITVLSINQFQNH